MAEQHDEQEPAPERASADRLAALARQLGVDPDRVLDVLAANAEVLDDAGSDPQVHSDPGPGGGHPDGAEGGAGG